LPKSFDFYYFSTKQPTFGLILLDLWARQIRDQTTFNVYSIRKVYLPLIPHFVSQSQLNTMLSHGLLTGCSELNYKRPTSDTVRLGIVPLMDIRVMTKMPVTAGEKAQLFAAEKESV